MMRVPFPSLASVRALHCLNAALPSSVRLSGRETDKRPLQNENANSPIVLITQNLTENTHYIASTGIGGRHADPKVLVQMDSYAIGGLQPGQVKYLYAPTHLNPTYEYGVTFERGSYVEYGDRRHVFISGTASINNRGEVVHVGDVRQQTLRMWENVETLLAEAGCSYDDVAHMVVYLRDTADYAVVKQLYDERFPKKPKVFLLARVCRPGWLVEMECMAIKDTESSYPNF